MRVGIVVVGSIPSQLHECAAGAGGEIDPSEGEVVGEALVGDGAVADHPRRVHGDDGGLLAVGEPDPVELDASCRAGVGVEGDETLVERQDAEQRTLDGAGGTDTVGPCGRTCVIVHGQHGVRGRIVHGCGVVIAATAAEDGDEHSDDRSSEDSMLRRTARPHFPVGSRCGDRRRSAIVAALRAAAIDPGTAVADVASRSPEQQVIAPATDEPVGAGSADQPVPPTAPEQHVVTAEATDDVVAARSSQRVGSTGPPDGAGDRDPDTAGARARTTYGSPGRPDH